MPVSSTPSLGTFPALTISSRWRRRHYPAMTSSLLNFNSDSSPPAIRSCQSHVTSLSQKTAGRKRRPGPPSAELKYSAWNENSLLRSTWARTIASYWPLLSRWRNAKLKSGSRIEGPSGDERKQWWSRGTGTISSCLVIVITWSNESKEKIQWNWRLDAVRLTEYSKAQWSAVLGPATCWPFKVKQANCMSWFET